MKHFISWLVLSIAFLIGETVALYSKNGNVQILDSKNFKKTITESDQLTLVEFYAPWCGHCKNLAPIYNKIATSLTDMVNVAAIDCDEEMNKPICGQYGIQGFPTIKVMRPKTNKAGGRSFSVEDYNGQRTVKAIAEHVTSIMPSNVKKINDDTLQEFLNEKNRTAKVVLFSKKGATSSIFKALSTSFGDSFMFAQVRDTQKAAVDQLGIKEFPSLVLLPGGTKSPVSYSEELKLPQLKKFLSPFATVDDGGVEAALSGSPSKDTPQGQDKSDKSQKFSFQTLETVEEVKVHLFGTTARMSLLVPGTILKDLALKSKPSDVALYQYTALVGQYLQDNLGTPKDQMMFISSKKSWYVAASHLPDSYDVILEFVDKVKHGEAGKKVKFASQEQKVEL